MNFKHLLFSGLAALTSVSALAIPAKRGDRTFTQADGTPITVRLIGDERSHTYTTTDGLALRRAADGNFYYEGISGASSVIAHNIGQRTQQEAAFILANAADIQASKVMARRHATKAPKREAIRKATQVPNNGSPRIPILLVQYKDKKFIDKDPKTTFESFFSHGDTSAYQYFTDQSNGKYTPQFDVYGPYTLSKNRSYYGANDYYGNDEYLGEMVAEGCQGLNSQIDFSKYDNDGDGECDVVIMLYAGDGEASSYEDDAEDSVWPCQWDLSHSDYGKSLRLDNTVVNKFAVFNEAYGRDITKIDGIGTFCHEFSHCMGLPDFYDTEYNGHFGMAHWSLMDYGSYNNEGYTPIGYSAYEKEFMGWISIPEVEENTYYTLPVFNQKNINTDKAVKLTSSKNKNEYYIIENRANQGWDKFMPAEGLLIYHVDYVESAWDQNIVNDNDVQLMSPIPADNDLKITKQTYYGQVYYDIDEASLMGDLWPYKNATELTDTSKPAATLHTGGYMGKPITDMVRNADGTISFWAMRAPVPAVAAPHSLSHYPEDSESVTLSWLPGDDADVTYTIEVKNHKDITFQKVASADFSTQPSDWTTGDGYTNYEDGIIRLGSTRQKGSVTSPSFTTDATGEVSVLFNAAYYGSDGSSIRVSLISANGTTVASKDIPLDAVYDDYVVYFNTIPSSSMKVKFECIANKKRILLASADIYTGHYEPEALRAKAASADEDYLFTISGHNATSYTLTGLKSGIKYDCRVKAVPTDADSFRESPWSEVYQFEHTGTTVVTITDTADTTAHYYTLQGIYLGTERPAAPGLYIIRRAGHTTKIIIR